MVCDLPLCHAIDELNKDAENNVQPGEERYRETWKAYLAAGGSTTMRNDLICDCKHKHFVRVKRG